ncbi:MAG: hypothetical protein UV40_C0025G0003 [Parcubacteria group bacterium GW2011_GWA1_42_7]|nr:MAG: hypothetical protein UV34_C0007G0008 [Parcubacteria group bacterium GW2011_GWB1_42_6]KKS69365.1 MAG: hypothetical protein UV40_C0025G0003 [Parcubacteria group bacterium GW2011_GWA1_42_7]KKS92111.1 MAG: hypothetical protein UV67_C0010G0016 [Parcubacteria group bacterium GW2011_GWC1_43_12]
MQFNLPQFVDVEDKILGPLTLKQFFLVVGVGLLLALAWYKLKLWIFIIIGGPVIAFVLAILFLKINGRPFSSFMISWFNFWTKPKTYVWKKK